MKFFTIVLFESSLSEDSKIREYVSKQMEPFKLREEDDKLCHPGWKWDYYCLYEKEDMAELGFKRPKYEFMKEDSNFVVFPTDKMTIEHMAFAVLTPDGKWFSGLDPSREPESEWPQRALKLIRETKASHGVYVYCHS